MSTENPLPDPGERPWLPKFDAWAEEVDAKIAALILGNDRMAFDPRDFGAIGDGNPENADADAAGWQAALDRAAASQGPGKAFVRATGNYFTNVPLIHDATVPIIAHAQITSLIEDANEFMWKVTSTEPSDISSPVRHRSASVEGLILEGDGITSGVSFDGTDTVKVAHTTWRNCVIRDHNVGIYFGQNAYMSTFIAVNIQLNQIGFQYTGEANSGERLEIIGGEITGSKQKAFELTSDQAMHFTSVSLSYNVRQLGTTTQGQLYFTSCHLEFDSPLQTYLELTSSGSIATFANCRFLIGERAGHTGSAVALDGTITTTGVHEYRVGDQVNITGSTVAAMPIGSGYFVVAVDRATKSFKISATAGGPVITPAATGFVTTAYVADFPVFNAASAFSRVVINGGSVHGSADTLPYLGVGPGSIYCRGTNTLNNAVLTAHLTSGEQLLQDRSFENAAILDDFSLTNLASGDTLVTTTADAHSGARSLMLSKVTKGVTSYTQVFIPIDASSRILSSFWAKLDNPASVLNINWYYAGANKVIGPSLATSSRTGVQLAAWAQIKQALLLYRVSPPWARYLVIRFSGTQLESAGKLYIDDLEVTTF